jgi:(p)ppGpp synthase/HD superfamily hydrolase
LNGAAQPHPVPSGRDPGFVRLGERFEAALDYAVWAHREQARKQTAVPYLAHLLGVTSITLEQGGDEDQAIGALLHDTLEELTRTVGEIRRTHRALTRQG